MELDALAEHYLVQSTVGNMVEGRSGPSLSLGHTIEDRYRESTGGLHESN